MIRTSQYHSGWHLIQVIASVGANSSKNLCIANTEAWKKCIEPNMMPHWLIFNFLHTYMYMIQPLPFVLTDIFCAWMMASPWPTASEYNLPAYLSDMSYFCLHAVLNTAAEPKFLWTLLTSRSEVMFANVANAWKSLVLYDHKCEDITERHMSIGHCQVLKLQQKFSSS